MSNAIYNIPTAINEPILNHAPGSTERMQLKATLAAMRAEVIEVPMYIDGKAVHTSVKADIRPPHDHQHLLGKYSVGDASHVKAAIDAALKAKEEAGKLLDQGYELAKGAVNGIADKALKFDLPNFDYPLVNFPGQFVIAIQYKASSKPKGQPTPTNYVGKFDFDVDSFAGDLADTWKGRMNNLAMVVSIGPLTDVMTIKGNFNSKFCQIIHKYIFTKI